MAARRTARRVVRAGNDRNPNQGIVAGDRPTPKRGSPKAPTRGTARGTTNPVGLRRGGVYEPDRGGQGTRRPTPAGNDRNPNQGKPPMSTGSASAKPKPRTYSASVNKAAAERLKAAKAGTGRASTAPKKAPTYSGSKAKKARKIR